MFLLLAPAIAMSGGCKGARRDEQTADMRILYRQPVPGVPVVETYQQRHESDVLLGYIVEVCHPSCPWPFQEGQAPDHDNSDSRIHDAAWCASTAPCELLQDVVQ